VATTDMGRKEGDPVPLSQRAGNPSNTMWPGPRSTSIPSGVFTTQPFGLNRRELKTGPRVFTARAMLARY